MTHYYINSDGSVVYTSQVRHETTWTITNSSRLKDLVIGRREPELSEDNRKLDNFLKAFVKE